MFLLQISGWFDLGLPTPASLRLLIQEGGEGGTMLCSVGSITSPEVISSGKETYFFCFGCSAWHLGRVVSMEPVLFHLWERVQRPDPHVQAPTVWWEPLRGPGEANEVLQHRTLPR